MLCTARHLGGEEVLGEKKSEEGLMKEGRTQIVLNGVGAVFCFVSALLGGIGLPGFFLPGVTFPLGVGIFLIYEILHRRPISTEIDEAELPVAFRTMLEGKKAGLAIGVIITTASAIPAFVFLFKLHEVQATLSMAFLSMGFGLPCILGTTIDRREIKQVLEARFVQHVLEQQDGTRL